MKLIMKKHFIFKIHILLLFTIPLLSSCELDCPAFDNQIAAISLNLFPDERQQYIFANFSSSGTSQLRFDKSTYEFTEAYKQPCGFPSPCDCDTSLDIRYISNTPFISIYNEATLF